MCLILLEYFVRFYLKVDSGLMVSIVLHKGPLKHKSGSVCSIDLHKGPLKQKVRGGLLFSFSIILFLFYDWEREWQSPHPLRKQKKHAGGHLPIPFK